ncbi:hypothetical protein EYR38_003071 [Pleurotus pulmonarius]|nr:hypothetical protein EYR38_003071 [Pleurotus pulmonarius]
MFSRVSSLFIAFVAFTILAAAMPGGGYPKPTTVTVTATPKPTETSGSGSQCSTGPIQCCNSVQSSGSGGLVSVLLGLLGVVLGGIDVPIGLTCNPISVIGIGGNSCNAQAVCCENNSFNGLIAIGCTPININI